jgi:dTDP-4-dehydrorhamnose reductase
MTTLLIGADGQLGRELRQAFSDQDLVPLTHSDLELTDRAQVRDVLRKYRPSLILNTAAYHRVDECEDQPERAFAVNAVAVRDLATAAKEIGAILVHFSTDYVFDGKQRSPYREVDRPGPLSVYATSKLAGEYFIQAVLERYYLIRTCGLYGLAGSRSKAGNFVETMLRLAADGREIRVVGDQIVAPTSAKELASKVRQLVRTKAYGLYILRIMESAHGTNLPRRFLHSPASRHISWRRPALFTALKPLARPILCSRIRASRRSGSMTCNSGRMPSPTTSPSEGGCEVRSEG